MFSGTFVYVEDNIAFLIGGGGYYLSISCTPGAQLFWPLDQHPLLSLDVDPSIALDSLTREPHHYILSGCSKGGRNLRSLLFQNINKKISESTVLDAYSEFFLPGTNNSALTKP
ncbi:hypothetical protein AB205_0083360 [Aquarana catesbeiana]|uniref:Uncharacterized protein n=1 Tax=Aquarana catesbeiana TaxID=8400 RepID=A0A2G9RVZ5_AQUCT|nr:hypothetical protein AB205_0083360 [Aquarana catesbeiana]